MPELTANSPEAAPDALPTVTVTAVPAPSPVPDPPAPPAEPPPAPEPALPDEVVLDLVDGINQLNTVLEGGDPAGDAGGLLLLDPVQFGVLGVALALVVALLAALVVLGMRR